MKSGQPIAVTREGGGMAELVTHRLKDLKVEDSNLWGTYKCFIWAVLNSNLNFELDRLHVLGICIDDSN